MILFISSWHLVALLGVFLGFAALLGVWGILWAARAALDHRQDEDQAKREKRSAAAKQGHVTRRARVGERVPMSDEEIQTRERLRERIRRSLESEHDDEVERVLRQIDAQAEAKAK